MDVPSFSSRYVKREAQMKAKSFERLGGLNVNSFVQPGGQSPDDLVNGISGRQVMASNGVISNRSNVPDIKPNNSFAGGKTTKTHFIHPAHPQRKSQVTSFKHTIQQQAVKPVQPLTGSAYLQNITQIIKKDNKNPSQTNGLVKKGL
jgi:hypothetical protein